MSAVSIPASRRKCYSVCYVVPTATADHTIRWRAWWRRWSTCSSAASGHPWGAKPSPTLHWSARKMRGVLITAMVALLARASVAAETQPGKTLAECLAIAVEQHPSLKAASASVDAGRQRVYQATANYLPQVSATYAANRRNTSPSARVGVNVDTRTQTFNFYNTGASFTQ